MAGALGKVGPEDAPISEWLKALHADQPAQHRKSIAWSRILLFFHCTLFVVSIATGLWVLPLILTFLSVPSELCGVYFVWGLPQHVACGENARRFPQEHTLDDPQSPWTEFIY